MTYERNVDRNSDVVISRKRPYCEEIASIPDNFKHTEVFKYLLTRHNQENFCKTTIEALRKYCLVEASAQIEHITSISNRLFALIQSFIFEQCNKLTGSGSHNRLVDRMDNVVNNVLCIFVGALSSNKATAAATTTNLPTSKSKTCSVAEKKLYKKAADLITNDLLEEITENLVLPKYGPLSTKRLKFEITENDAQSGTH